MKSILHSIALILLTTCGVATCSAQVEMLDVREGTGIPSEVRSIYEKGADYLASTQQEDGTWGKAAKSHGKETNGVCALCVMAFLSTGEDPNFGKYAKNVRKALQHIIRNQDPETGYLQGSMYVHGFAMLALAEAFGTVDDELLWAGEKDNDKTRTVGEALELAVRLAVTSQMKNPTNGWRYAPDSKDADTSIVGAVLMGLLAARNAGIEVPDESIDKALQYMKGMTSDSAGTVGYASPVATNDSSARSSIACLVFAIGKRRHWKEFEATKDYVADHPLGRQNWIHYTRYYQAQALFQADYPAWQKWNRDTIRTLGDMQTEDGQIGTSRFGDAYSTSMSLLALALNFRFLPIYER